MRYFENKRRQLMKNHYISGTQKSVSGKDMVEIISSSGSPFGKLEIAGRTSQETPPEIFNANKEYFTNLENYVFGDISYTYLIPFPEEWIDKDLYFELTEKNKMTDISFELADGTGLFVSTERLLDYNGDISYITSDKYTYFRFTSILTDELTEISDFWNNYTLKVYTELSPDFPSPIESLNDNGTSLVLYGNNLADCEEFCKIISSKATNVQLEERSCMRYTQEGMGRFVIEGGFKENTQYTISFEGTKRLIGNYTTSGSSAAMYIFYKDLPINYARDSISLSTSWTKRTKTTLKGQTVVGIGLVNAEYRNYIYIDIDTFCLYEGAIDAPIYEPYFYKALQIPTDIEKEGQGVPGVFLNMTQNDRLIVDCKSKRVTYTQGSYLYEFSGNESDDVLGGSDGKFTFAPDHITGNEGLYLVNGAGQCSHFKKVDGYSQLVENSFAVDFDFDRNRVFFKLEDTTLPLMGFKEFLIQQKANGTPLTLLLKREVPQLFDLTSTALGQALLSLCVPRNQSAKLKISGALDTIPIKLTYYSSEVEDVVNITIKYTNQSGADICEPRVEEVRQGSKYLIVTPHIDGYKRVSTEIFGVADEDATIELIYK